VWYDENCAPCHGDQGKGQSASSLAAVFASIDPYQYVRAAMGND
jgi:cytochrome c